MRLLHWLRVRVLLGRVVHVRNRKRMPEAAGHYNHVRVRFPNGDRVHLLFTDREILDALHRADKNPEDLR